MAEELFVQQLDNGLTLLGERLEHVVSAAMNLALPAGSARDGAHLAGAAGVLSEWLFRGAGERNSRQLNDALDSLGAHHDERVHSAYLQLTSAQVHQNLRPVLEIYADLARRPRLEEQTFQPCQDLCLQELESLEDQPARKCNLRVRERFYPQPMNASALGTPETVAGMTPRALQAHARRHLTPDGAILAVAGRFEWSELTDRAEALFGDWHGPRPEPQLPRPPAGGVAHEPKPTAQVQIALAYPAPLAGTEHYYPMRVAEMVLSGGMSGRLFTEVREKRGLVYSVGARYQNLKEAAGIFVYAGTTPQRAQETLEVVVGELRRLNEGLTDHDIATAKTQLKSALVMQGESTSARSAGLVADWYLLGRLRPLQEIADAIDAVTREQVLACLAAFPAKDLVGYFIGPEPMATGCLA